jgi:hypothetical protein
MDKMWKYFNRVGLKGCISYESKSHTDKLVEKIVLGLTTMHACKNGVHHLYAWRTILEEVRMLGIFKRSW